MSQEKRKRTVQRAESTLAGDWGDDEKNVSEWEIDESLIAKPEPYADPFIQAEKLWRDE